MAASARERAAEVDVDDDDDDAVDLSAYDVGVQSSPDSAAEQKRASSPSSDEEPGGWPAVGESVRARYSAQSSTFRTARVVGLDFQARSVALRFDGWGDIVNVPLARALFKSVKIGRMIPKTLFQAVAEVLAYVYRVKRQKFD